jgi:hypothetical protein
MGEKCVQFKPFNYSRKLTFFPKECLINAFALFAYYNNMKIR